MNDLERVLSNLIESTSSESAILVNSEGLTVASVGAKNEDRIAVMIASLHSMGEKFSADLEKGGVNQFYIKTDTGYLLLKEVNKNTIIGLIAKDQAKLGLLMMYLDASVKEISGFLSDDDTEGSLDLNIRSIS
ncbi:MAG: roadblock/LC7 domain-containing protein [Flavobacteriaceae bacterium]|nr:roadblock/LC7 domain-containing protein [Flavobacteriaceae bacterium]